ncbi:MAG TPA: alpha/beta hydrolase domain-containing protein [Burkholderiales bacterium]|nr:alpha/beta hydrolase domain-containing protein [Burkholderiales bacterium]
MRILRVFAAGTRLLAGAGLLAVVAMLSPPVWAVVVPNPTVTAVPANAAPGDPSHDYPYLTTAFDLDRFGYVEEEFFVEGTANRYNTPTGATGSVISSGHPYKTRIIVRRPKSNLRFNGTVVLEWQNVTAGYELDAHWFASYNHFMRDGYVWVGVSAQRVGIHSAPTFAIQQALKQWSPIRYGTLDVTVGGTINDDSLSYDIFSQVAQAIRHPVGVDPLGKLRRPSLIFATGASQSAGRLVVYHNSIYPQLENPPVDAFYLLVGGNGTRVDLNVKVFQLLSETDVYLAALTGAVKRNDDENFRRWEAAGTSHSSQRLADGIEPLYARDGIVAAPANCTFPPRSRIPFHFAHNAAYNHLVRWVKFGIAPPSAPPIAFASTTPPVAIARDADGNALGGIQLPQHAVPTALNSGQNTGGGFCILFGTHQPYDETKLGALYPSHGNYVSQVVHSTIDNLKAGHMLWEDAFLTTHEAVHSDIGKN